MTEDELPRRLSGQLFVPEPLRPVWIECDPELLQRVRDGLVNLRDDAAQS